MNFLRLAVPPVFAVLFLCAWPALAQATGAGESPGLYADLVKQGPIGIVCVLLIGWQIRLYADARADRVAASVVLTKKDDEHKKQEDEKDAKILMLALDNAKHSAETTAVLVRVVEELKASNAARGR